MNTHLYKPLQRPSLVQTKVVVKNIYKYTQSLQFDDICEEEVQTTGSKNPKP